MLCAAWLQRQLRQADKQLGQLDYAEQFAY
jgi:hypothetical protein